MAPEEAEPSQPTDLERLLLYSSLDGIQHSLAGSGFSSWRADGRTMTIVLERFTDGGVHECADAAAQIQKPEILARCLFEVEQADPGEVDTLIEEVRVSSWRELDDVELMKALSFLDRLRENGEGGSDGGAGVREPHPPHDPKPGGAVSLETPRDETLTEPEDGGGSVALLEHPRRSRPGRRRNRAAIANRDRVP